MVTSFVDTLAAKSKLSATEFRGLTEGNLGLVALMASGMSRLLSDGTQTSASYQMRISERIAGRGHRFAFANYTNTGTSAAETSGANAITVKASLLTATSGGQLIPLAFGGASSVTIQPDQTIYADALAIDIPQGANVYMVTYVSVGSAGQKWPLTRYGVASQLEGVTNGSDLTASATGIASYVNGYVYGPVAAFGIPAKAARTARVALVGDSILRGASTTDDAAGLNILTPLSQTSAVQIAAFGETAGAFATIAGHRRRIGMIHGCTSWLCNYGANDVKAGTPTFTIVATALLGVWSAVYERLGAGWQTTITPNTSSTDSWATTTNQTVAASPYSNTVRAAVNDWIRDGAPILSGAPAATGSSAAGTLRAGAAGHPLAGYFEAADATETSRNSGIWKAAYTFDGIHPSPAGYTAMRDAITWTSLGIV